MPYYHRMNQAAPASAVIITGAASGIGRAIVLRLAVQARPLVLIDLNRTKLSEVSAEALAAGATEVWAYPVDVSDRDQLNSAVEEARAASGSFAAIISAAGILEPASLAEVTLASWERHFAVNTTGVMNLLQAATPDVVDGGSVVVVSSNAARVPRTGMVAYAASKAATSALTRCVGLELASRHVRCNVIEPGSTDTAMQRDLWPDAEQGRAAALAGDLTQFRIGIPLERIGDPDDVAALAEFLVSDGSRHITLQQIYVDGGASL